MDDIDSLFTIEKPINNPRASPSPTHREGTEDTRDTLLNSPTSLSFDTPERPKIPATHSSSPTEIIEPGQSSEFVQSVNRPERRNFLNKGKKHGQIVDLSKSILPTYVVHKDGKTPDILTLAAKTNLTNSEIARSLDVSRSAVSVVMLRYGIDRNNMESFKKDRADVFVGLQEKFAGKIASGLDSVPIKSARDVKDMSTALAIIYDKEQLERGRPTSITDYRGITLEVKGTLEDIEKALNLGQGDKDEPVDL